MVYLSDLTDWQNGNISDLDTHSLISIACYFEKGQRDEDIIDDLEEEEY